MVAMAKANGSLSKLTAEQLAALTRPPLASSGEERLRLARRAMRGLRLDIRVTPSLYRPR